MIKLVKTTDELFDQLFTISISHSGFDTLSESMISEHVELVPDKETKMLLKNYKMGSHFDNDVFVCYIKCRLENPPASSSRVAYVVPTPAVLFRFLLKVSDHFMNTTVIKPVKNGAAYYFSNRSNASTGMFISHDAGEVNDNDLIAVPPPEVDIRQTYLGVIDIFCSGAVSPSYELFSGVTGRLRRPQYQLLFRSRI